MFKSDSIKGGTYNEILIPDKKYVKNVTCFKCSEGRMEET